MSYVPYNNKGLSPEKKTQLLREYIQYYEGLVEKGRLDLLNQKLPRSAASEFLDTIGCLLQSEAQRLAHSSNEVREFLDATPLPGQMAELLPDEFRVFTLLLNALKQWVSAESQRCDRYLMGGRVRDYCRKSIDHCLVTGEPLEGDIELHHPVRDGRPPIPLSKKGHTLIENQSSGENCEVIDSDSDSQSAWDTIKAIRNQRTQSWVQLREGLEAIKAGSMGCRPNAKSFANKVIEELHLSPEAILALMEEHGK